MMLILPARSNPHRQGVNRTGGNPAFLSSAGSTGGDLAVEAFILGCSRPWIALSHAACPAFPESWIAAVRAQECGFRPDDYDESNGGAWGMLQRNASIRVGADGAPWIADRYHNGV